jgi:hypothetical protein
LPTNYHYNVANSRKEKEGKREDECEYRGLLQERSGDTDNSYAYKTEYHWIRKAPTLPNEHPTR